MPARKKAEPQSLLASQGYSQITVLAAAKNLGQGTAGAIPAGTTAVLVNCEAQAVRWRDDGTAPTAALGMLMQANDVVFFDQRLDRLQFIEAGTAGAKLNVTFYRDS